jgi:hypothetical protein
MRKRKRRQLADKIETMMLEEELNLNELTDQHSRAYHTGVIDGLGQALFAISPKRARRNPISIVWFDEEFDKPRELEQAREQSFDICYAGLFESVEAN